MAVVVIRGNALSLPLPDESVDLVVTSPPYFGLRSYKDDGEHYADQVGGEATPVEYLDALTAATVEWMRVLKSSGSIFINLGDKYSQRTQVRRSSHQPGMHPGRHAEFAESWAERAAKGAVRMPHQNIVAKGVPHVPEKSLMLLPQRYAIRCIDDLGLICRAEIVWDKPNGNPEKVQDRVRRSHEHWYHFVKNKHIYSDVSVLNGVGSRSVWEVPVSTRLDVPDDLNLVHAATFPLEWPRRIVLGWCPPGGVVLDPFGGSGTTALVASVLGRVGVSVDLSADYCRLARWRTSDEKQRSKVAAPR